MTIFDMANSLDKTDPKTFALSTKLRNDRNDINAVAPVDIIAPTFKADAFNAQLDNAYKSVIENNLPRKEVLDPTTYETVKAAFQSGNTIGSALSSEVLAEHLSPTQYSPELTDDQIIDAVAKRGHSALLQSYQGVTNQAQLDARADQIDREQKNIEIMEASGLPGVAAMLVAGVVDLPTLLPVGKALQLGRKGATLGEATLKTAAAGVIDAGVSEAGLQATQQLRTGEESVLNIASGAIIGAAIGGSVHKILGHVTANKVIADLDAHRADAANNFRRGLDDIKVLDREIAAANGVPAKAADAPPPTSHAGPVTGFTTAKGSTYEIQPNGTTVRNKAARSDPGHEGDSGIKPASKATYYVDNPTELGLVQAQGLPGKATIEALSDGTIGVKYLDGKDAGKFEQRTVTVSRTEPEVGLTPVEVWDNGVIHFGNKITEVRRGNSNVADAPGAPSKSAGAAFSDLAQEASDAGARTDAKVSAYMLDRLPSITTAPTEYLSRIIGGRTLLGRPRDAFRQSGLDTVRQFGRMFYSSPEISEANAIGKKNFGGMTVEDHIGEDLGMLSSFKAEVDNIYAANKTRFRNVNDLAEQAYYAALNEGVDSIKSDPALEAVARAFLKYSDYQEAKHIANNRLADDTQVMGSKSRVQRMYNQTALREDEARAKEMLYRWAKRKIEADREAAYAETGYGAKMQAYTESAGTYQARVEKRETDYAKAMTDWNAYKSNAEFEDKIQYEAAKRDWIDKVAEWNSNRANDGKNHPYKKPFKKDYKTPIPAKPLKGAAETVTEGNPKPAHPDKIAFPQDTGEWATALADDVYNTLAGVKSQVARGSAGRVSVRTGYLKGRVVDIPDDALADSFFLKTNLLEHAEHMHYTSGRDAALGSVFKTVKLVTREDGTVDKLLVGDYDGNSILKAIEEEADATINEVSGNAKTVLIDQREKMLQGVKNEIDIARGAFDAGTGLIGPRAAHYLASAAYTVRLGGVTVSSLTDAPKIVIAHGLSNTFRFGIMPMLRDFRAAIGKDGAMRAQGVRTGNVVEVLHNTRMADAFELHNPHAVGTKFEQVVDRMTKMATQYSLISHWTDLVKQTAHNVTSSRILGYADMGFDRLSKKNQAWLANLGLDADDLAKIKGEYANQETKHVAGVLYADLDRWSDPELSARFGAAFRREGRNNVVTPGLGDRPQFMHTPDGKLIYQFQTFMLTDQVRFVARQAQLSNIAGDASEKARQRLAFGAGLASLTMGAVFVDSMKRALRDNDVDWDAFVKRWEDNPGGSMYDAIDRAGFMGSLFGASNTAGKFTNGQFSIRGGTQWLAGDKDRGEARKVRDIGLGGTLFGPAAGIAEDLVKTGQAVAKIADGGSLNRTDLRRMQNTLPYHAIPGIQQGLTALREMTADRFGMPETAK